SQAMGSAANRALDMAGPFGFGNRVNLDGIGADDAHDHDLGSRGQGFLLGGDGFVFEGAIEQADVDLADAGYGLGNTQVTGTAVAYGTFDETGAIDIELGQQPQHPADKKEGDRPGQECDAQRFEWLHLMTGGRSGQAEESQCGRKGANGEHAQ